MDKKVDKEYKDIQDGTSDELLDFLNNSNTYFVEDEKTGVVGDKKTGIMLDKRTGKVFSEKNFKELKYDFLDYKESINILNDLDNIKLSNEDDVVSREETYFDNQDSNLSVKENSILNEENNVEDEFIKEDIKKVLDEINNEDIQHAINNNEKEINDSYDFENKDNGSSPLLNKIKLSKKDVNLKNYIDKKFKSKNNELFDKELNDLEKNENVNDINLNTIDNSDIDVSKQSDQEILDKINEKFNSVENQFSTGRNINDRDNILNSYNFSSFEEYEEKTEEKNKNNLDIPETDIELESKNELDKFKMIMDFEDYLFDMSDDETILKSPFEETDQYVVPEIKVEEDEKDGLFLPFDSLTDFEVEEIQTYDLESENLLEEGMFPEFDLNKSISKKVSIREVIKSKQKKKQEQKELQEKLFFDTIDERIEQFKKFKEHSIDSQEVLNAINVDLNRINSSIKVEFESLKNKRNSKKKSVKADQQKENKFSLQNLLEEISENKELDKSSIVDTPELDIESINKDLAKNENDSKIVN